MAAYCGGGDARSHRSDSTLEAFLQQHQWTDGDIILADCYRLAGDHEASLRYALRGLSAAQSASSEQLTIRAAALAMSAHNRLGDIAASVKIFNQVKNITDPSGAISYYIAESAFLAGKLDRANDYIARARKQAEMYLAVAPDSFLALQARVFVEQALSQSAAGDDALPALQSAISTFARMIRPDPESQGFWGVALQQLAQLQPGEADQLRSQAQILLASGLAAFPQQSTFRLSLADIEMHLGKYEPALVGYRTLAARNFAPESTQRGLAAAALS